MGGVVEMSNKTNEELREYLRERKIAVADKFSHLETEKPSCSIEELRAMFDKAGVSLADEIVKEREASRF
jgi:hypothetical protein